MTKNYGLSPENSLYGTAFKHDYEREKMENKNLLERYFRSKSLQTLKSTVLLQTQIIITFSW